MEEMGSERGIGQGKVGWIGCEEGRQGQYH